MVKYEKKGVTITTTETLIIEAEVNERTNKSVLVVNSGAVNMTVSIYGSPDGIFWFAIEEDYAVNAGAKKAFTEFYSIYSKVKLTGKTLADTTTANGWILFDGTQQESKFIIGDREG